MNIFTFFSKFKDKWKLLFSNKKKSYVLVFAIVVVIVFFVLSSTFNKPKTNSETSDTHEFSISTYSKNVEDKLQTMLLKVEEITSASVMVMVESTPKIEYLTETEEINETTEKDSSSTKTTTVVFEKDGSVSTPVVVTTIMPKITGVFIVVNNISASTKVSIINSISVVLNVDATCISILQES